MLRDRWTRATRKSYAPDWSELPQSGAQQHRGEVEWILKNSYPRLTTTVLRGNLQATPGYEGFPGGYFPESDAIAATQAAIWHFTDGKDIDLTNSNPNNTRVKLLYRYLLEKAAGQPATTAQAPTVTLHADGERSAFAVLPGASFGPFTLESSANATVTATGAARIVGDDGAALTGPQTPGTRFWVQPTATPAVDGATTVTAQTVNVTSTFVNVALGKQNVSPFAARENLAVLATATQSAHTTLALSWEIDRNSSDDFDPDGGATEREYNYWPRGELSPTLERLVFTDGSTTETDLIGLTGRGNDRSADVYSADFVGTATGGGRGPSVPSGAQFIEGDWLASPRLDGNEYQGEVARILQRSYPERSVAQLSEELKVAGVFAADAGNIKNYEAIAATQAAIWHFTSGKALDTTRYATPSSAQGAGGASAAAVLDGDAGSVWRADTAGETYIDVVFPANFEPRTYSVTSAAGGELAHAPTTWRLQRSTNGGATYTDVSTGAVSSGFTEAGQTVRSGNIPPGASYGAYTTQYRIVFTGAQDAALPVEIGEVSFEGFGVFGTQPNYVYKQYANASNVVLAYQHLIADALAHPVLGPGERVVLEAATSEFVRDTNDDLIGPFVFDGTLAAEIRLADAAGDAHLLVNPTSDRETSLVLEPGDTFWVYPGDSDAGDFTITASSGAVDWLTARALNNATGEAPTLTQLGVESRRFETDLAVSFTLFVAPDTDPDSGTDPDSDTDPAPHSDADSERDPDATANTDPGPDTEPVTEGVDSDSDGQDGIAPDNGTDQHAGQALKRTGAGFERGLLSAALLVVAAGIGALLWRRRTASPPIPNSGTAEG